MDAVTYIKYFNTQQSFENMFKNSRNTKYRSLHSTMKYMSDDILEKKNSNKKIIGVYSKSEININKLESQESFISTMLCA